MVWGAAGYSSALRLSRLPLHLVNPLPTIEERHRLFDLLEEKTACYSSSMTSGNRNQTASHWVLEYENLRHQSYLGRRTITEYHTLYQRIVSDRGKLPLVLTRVFSLSISQGLSLRLPLSASGSNGKIGTTSFEPRCQSLLAMFQVSYCGSDRARLHRDSRSKGYGMPQGRSFSQSENAIYLTDVPNYFHSRRMTP